MKAMLLDGVYNLRKTGEPLKFAEIPDPRPGKDELLLKVKTCGVCHTELDEIEGRTPPQRYPVVPGHQVVGEVLEAPSGSRYKTGDRVGVAWIFSSCGKCKFCLSGNENLCEQFVATGRDVNGGYAEYMAVPEKSVYLIPETFSDTEAAPLLCAGAIGYRSLRLTNMANGNNLGLTGFGSSGQLVLKMARYNYPDSGIYVFARSEKERKIALDNGATWAGDTSDTAPVKLDAIIDTTPVWKPVVEALKNLDAGGRLVINAIRKEDHDKEALSQLNYTRHLWMEKEIKSVANVAYDDVRGVLELAAEIPIIPDVKEFALEEANKALLEIKKGHIRGASVLVLGR